MVRGRWGQIERVTSDLDNSVYNTHNTKINRLVFVGKGGGKKFTELSWF